MSPTAGGSGGGGSGGSGGVGNSGGTAAEATLPSALATLGRWGYCSLLYTRQLVSERLGRATRTEDPELEAAAESLRDARRRYQRLLAAADEFDKQLEAAVRAQRSMAECFQETARCEPALAELLSQSGEEQWRAARAGDRLLAAWREFRAAVAVLVGGAFADAVRTAGSCELARVEYDAYCSDSLLADQQLRHDSRQRYARLRHDVFVKINFLEEHRTRVMGKQLQQLRTALAAYYGPLRPAMEASIGQLSEWYSS